MGQVVHVHAFFFGSFFTVLLFERGTLTVDQSVSPGPVDLINSAIRTNESHLLGSLHMTPGITHSSHSVRSRGLKPLERTRPFAIVDGHRVSLKKVSQDRSGGVNVDHLVSVLGVSSTVAHELGHNLGMTHDTAQRHCQCQNELRLGGCIMEASTGLMPGQLFSSCSMRDLSLSLLHGGGVCLFNVPLREQLLGTPRCGNLYVERGEECDCGLLHECTDPCCNASTCKLVPGAQCSSDGVCCENCKLRVAGWVCREALGECDLPEFCSGTSPHCPANVFLQDGEPCQGGVSYCYSGVCASLDTQCQLLWGANSTRAPPVCFSSINKQGSKYGNCGQMSNGTYIPCAAVDVLCGKLQCQGGYNRPLLGSNMEILTTKLNHTDVTCRGVYVDVGDDVSDPGLVSQGTPCAPGKACVDQRCQDVSVFGADECHRKCNGHGVCNSNRNCHCEAGWAPPDCQYSGAGGSVDSGPLRQHTDSDPTRVALLVFFLFVLPVLMLVLAFRVPHCRRSLFCFNNTPFSKARQPSRTPAIERLSARNGEQVLPLRYQWTPQNDIPLTRAISKAQGRPAPPTKPLPPDPVSNQLSQSAGQRPAPPTKPLPPDPAPSESTTQRKPTVTRPAAPSKPLPPDPVLSDRQLEHPVPPRPPAPRKPLPADPCGYPTAGAPCPPSQPGALRPSQPGALRPPCQPGALRPPCQPGALRPPCQPGGAHAAPAVSSPFTTSAASLPARRAPLPPITTSHHPRKLHKPPQV
ncbi:disintegrin and metalloproteinase domain-containing protein 12-like [Brachyhypopomus gauderio]|uniref:disintegrin and metalloproteinase domain-containing protein 12-like n=1 Tax=Brachyhypopomus gauderio TaxID=698409 RepID=UPI0040415DD9